MDVSRAMRWTGLAGIMAYWMACLAAAGLLLRRSRRGDRRRGVALMALVLIGCSLGSQDQMQTRKDRLRVT